MLGQGSQPRLVSVKAISIRWLRLNRRGVPKTREDLAQWRNFVNRYRIEPTGSDRIRFPANPLSVQLHSGTLSDC